MEICSERLDVKKKDRTKKGYSVYQTDIADPSSKQDARHNELSKYDLARHKSPSSSVVRAPDRCTGGHGFDCLWGLRLLLCPTIATNWNKSHQSGALDYFQSFSGQHCKLVDGKRLKKVFKILESR